MIRFDKHKRKDGIKTQVRVVEGYRENGKIKQRTVKDFGYLEDQSDVDDFIESVKKFDENIKKKNFTSKRLPEKDSTKITIQQNITMDINSYLLFMIL